MLRCFRFLSAHLPMLLLLLSSLSIFLLQVSASSNFFFPSTSNSRGANVFVHFVLDGPHSVNVATTIFLSTLSPTSSILFAEFSGGLSNCFFHDITSASTLSAISYAASTYTFTVTHTADSSLAKLVICSVLVADAADVNANSTATASFVTDTVVVATASIYIAASFLTPTLSMWRNSDQFVQSRQSTPVYIYNTFTTPVVLGSEAGKSTAFMTIKVAWASELMTCSMVFEGGLAATVAAPTVSGTVATYAVTFPTQMRETTEFELRCLAYWRSSNESVFSGVSIDVALIFPSGFTLTKSPSYFYSIESTMNKTLIPIASTSDGEWVPALSGSSHVLGLAGNVAAANKSGTFYFAMKSPVGAEVYRGAPGSYCFLFATPLKDDFTGPAVSHSPHTRVNSLTYGSEGCTFSVAQMTITGTVSAAQTSLQVTMGIVLMDPPLSLTNNVPQSSVTFTSIQNVYRGVPTVLGLSPLFQTAPTYVTTFTPAGLFVPPRSFTVTVGSETLLYPDDWGRQMQNAPVTYRSNITSPRLYTRPRARYLHAQTTNAASAPVLGRLSPATSGQLTFWFGGIAFEKAEDVATSISTIRPILADLWMFDALGNTTTLLSGDPSQTRSSARLYNNG